MCVYLGICCVSFLFVPSTPQETSVLIVTTASADVHSVSFDFKVMDQTMRKPQDEGGEKNQQNAGEDAF